MREEGQVVAGVETIDRATPDGEAVVAATLAECLRTLAAAGGDQVLVDGHYRAEHLGPVLRTLPDEVPLEVLHSVALP